jgi:hypothetical protein
MFSPTFFWDYLSANRLRIETFYVIRYYHEPNRLWDAFEYSEAAWRSLSTGGLDNGIYAIFLVATRTEASTTHVIPQQGFYAASSAAYRGSRLASGAAAPVPDAHAIAAVAERSPAHLAVKSVLSRIPGGLRLARRLLGYQQLVRERGRRAGRGSPVSIGSVVLRQVGRY